MADSPASGLPFPARRRSYRLTAAVLLMLGGTLPVRPYVLYERQMGFGPLGVTVVFAAYVLGTLVALGTSATISRGACRRLAVLVKRAQAEPSKLC
jgi:VIT1/CCC1 family predicted Fe2+/Mn2+ transporter